MSAEIETASRRETMARHRQRLAERGMKRVEVLVPAGDASLVREFARGLCRGTNEAQRWRRAYARPAKKFAEWIQEPD